MRSSSQLVVDAGAGHVAGAVFRPGSGGRLVLEEFALEPRPGDPAAEPGWLEGTAKALAAVSARRRMRGPAALAVPGHLTLTKFVTAPAVPAAQRGQVIEFEAAQAIPYALEAVVWDHLTVAGDELEIMLTAVKVDVMENLCAAAEDAGFPVKRAAASSLALYRAFRFNYPEVNVPVLVLDIGARSTNLVLAGPGGRFHARNFPLAGNAVTAALARELQLDFAAAEALKLQASDPDAPVRTRVAKEFIGRLQLEITRSVGHFSWRTGAPPPVALYLTGGGSRLPGLAAALAEIFQVRVEDFDPLRQVDLADPARKAGAADAVQLLANLVGMAAPAPGMAGGEGGLLPPAVRTVRAFRRRQPRLLAAATLLVMALLAPLWHFHRLDRAQAEKVAEIDARLPELRARAERNNGRLRQLAATQAQVTALRRLADARSSWVGLLADLQERLGRIEDVWLDDLTLVRAPSPKVAATKNRPTAPAPGLQLRLQGRLLDPQHPDAKVSAASQARARALLASIATSPFVAATEGERFDTSQPGLLRFDLTLAVNPQHPL